MCDTVASFLCTLQSTWGVARLFMAGSLAESTGREGGGGLQQNLCSKKGITRENKDSEIRSRRINWITGE